jgi:small conductance mechanosensitive channel
MTVLDLSYDNLFDRLTQNLNHLLPMLLNAVVTALAGFVVIQILSWIARGLLSFTRMPKGLKEIIVSLLDGLLMIFLIIVVLKALGLNDLALAFTAGVAAIGIALGNGSATLVSDIIGGIYLARDRDFGIGDIVKAGENGSEGEILSMDMRRTRIRNVKGQIHSIPNSVIERKEYVLITKKRDRKAR